MALALQDREQLDRDQAVLVGAVGVERLELLDGPFALHVARRHDRHEGGGPAGVLRQVVKELVLQAAVVEEDVGVDPEPLPQGDLQVGLEAADPADFLRVRFVVEMSIADENVVLEPGNESHGATAASPNRKTAPVSI